MSGPPPNDSGTQGCFHVVALTACGFKVAWRHSAGIRQDERVEKPMCESLCAGSESGIFPLDILLRPDLSQTAGCKGNWEI